MKLYGTLIFIIGCSLSFVYGMGFALESAHEIAQRAEQRAADAQTQAQKLEIKCGLGNTNRDDR